MTPEDALQALALQQQVDEHATNNLYNHVERNLDATDRQIAQIAQLKNLSANDASYDALLGAVAELARTGADPLGVT